MHTVMMNSMLMNTAANAQGRCAVSACPEMNNSLILIMDAIVLASIIILQYCLPYQAAYSTGT